MPGSLKNYHFLIAGSDTAHMALVAEMLRAAEVGQLTAATSGRDAIVKWRTIGRVVDCVLGECKMPEGSGLQLLQAIRTGQVRNVRPDMCFIVIADEVDPKILSLCAQLDVNGFLVKPVNEERLMGAIAKGRKRVIKLNRALYSSLVIPEF